MFKLPPYLFVFDVESIGLHGEGFAVGWVVVDSGGAELGAGMAACDPQAAVGTDEGREWVAEHVDCGTTDNGPREVRERFWRAWLEWRGRGAVMAAECAWPVEARFLVACVDAEPDREWIGPYPLIDVASVRLAAGLDPLATEPRLPGELPAHDPLADARQSARLLIEALSAATVG